MSADRGYKLKRRDSLVSKLITLASRVGTKEYRSYVSNAFLVGTTVLVNWADGVDKTGTRGHDIIVRFTDDGGFDVGRLTYAPVEEHEAPVGAGGYL